LTWYDKVDYFTQIISNLKQREAIVKTPLVHEPFIITAAQVNIRQITRKALQHYLPKHQPDYTDAEQEFLESIANTPFLSMSERRRRLAWTKQVYHQIVKQLIETGVIEKVNVPLGRGRPLLLYQLKGKTPSIKHEYYVHWIAKQLREKGYVLQTNKVGPDITIPSDQTALNIELGKSDIQHNITLALQNFNRVIICSDNRNLLERISLPESLDKGKSVLKSTIWAVPDLF
jgi:hypothetical protein